MSKNGLETDIDCGGPGCGPCVDGKACLGPVDCKSGVCTGMFCKAPTCVDTVQNGEETDSDCGGGVCTTRCAGGKKCLAGRGVLVLVVLAKVQLVDPLSLRVASPIYRARP